jgi:hypothetical protein
MILDKLAIKYNTDKSSLDHDYIKHYSKYFLEDRELYTKVLELGIYTTNTGDVDKSGASLKMWSEFFPNADIFGLDIVDYSYLDKIYPKIKTFICNAELRVDSDINKITNPWLKQIYTQPQYGLTGGQIGMINAINKFGGDYDVIIDDGPHTVSSQQIFFGFMFKYLKSGGYLVIEDLHTSFATQTDNTGQLQYNSFPFTEWNTVKMLNHFIETGKIVSDFITEEEKEYIENNTEFAKMEQGKNSPICFIKHK